MAKEIKCKNCGKKYDSKFEHCPHCAAKKKKKSGCLFVFVSLVVIFLIAIIK